MFKPFPSPTPTNTPIPTSTPAPTAIPTATVPAGTLINGDFEQGATGWVFIEDGQTILREDSRPVSPHTGTKFAWLGGSNNSTSGIGQQVQVPRDRPYLTYWRWVISGEYCVLADALGVGFLNDDGVVTDDEVVEAYELCQRKNTSGWVRVSLDMRRFAGQTRTLIIFVGTDSTLTSNVFIDDIAFTRNANTASDEPAVQDDTIRGRIVDMLGRMPRE